MLLWNVGKFIPVSHPFRIKFYFSTQRTKNPNTHDIFIDDSSERGFASNTSVCTVLDSMDNGILAQHHTRVLCDGTCDAYAYKHFHIYGIQIDLG